MSHQKIISVILLNYNNFEYTISCIESIIKQETFNPLIHEIIVVDNCSTNNSFEELKKYQSNKRHKFLKVIQSEKNGGFGYGNNFGIKYSQSKYILMLNNDTVIKNLDFIEIVKRFESENSIGILTGKIFNDDMTVQSMGFEKITLLTEFKKNILFLDFFSRNKKKIMLDSKEIAWASGCFMFFSKQNFNMVGGFDEKIFMYAEDIDFSYRMMNLNKKNYVFTDFSIIHYEGKSNYFESNINKLKDAKKNHIYVYGKNKIFSPLSLKIVEIMNYFQIYIIYFWKKIKNLSIE